MGLFPDDQIMTPLRTEQHTVANDLGWGQTWQDVKASRVSGTDYTNTTGRPIYVSVSAYWGNVTAAITMVIDGITVAKQSNNPDSSDLSLSVAGIVPDGSTYSVTLTPTGYTVTAWAELR